LAVDFYGFLNFVMADGELEMSKVFNKKVWSTINYPAPSFTKFGKNLLNYAIRKTLLPNPPSNH
jgi:hypothetical protein